MSKEAFDEMSVLSAIYCEQGEFELLEESREFFWMHFSIRTVITRVCLFLIFYWT